MQSGQLVALVLRALHLLLGLLGCVFLAVGVPWKQLSASHASEHPQLWNIYLRVVFWLLLTILLYFASLAMFLSAVLILFYPGRFRLFESKRAWMSSRAPNFAFFYYLAVGLLVMYATMIGCHIKFTFGYTRVPVPLGKGRAFAPVGNRSPTHEETMLSASVFAGLLNTILHFVAAFYPLVGGETSSAVQEEASISKPSESGSVKAEEGSQDKKAEEESGAAAEQESVKES